MVWRDTKPADAAVTPPARELPWALVVTVS